MAPLHRVMFACCALAMTAHAGIVLEVIASQSPNTTSPSFAGWRQNVMDALENHLPSVGDPAATPTAFDPVTTVGDHTALLSSFPSWHGVADPGTAFGPAFAGETGNFIIFSLRATATDGTTFSLSELSGHILSDDPGHFVNFNFDFSSNNYSSGVVGVDPVSGNFITSGPGTQPVSALFYSGAGITLFAGAPLCPTGSDQEVLDCAAGRWRNFMPFHMVADYQFRDAAGNVIGSGSGSVLFDAPEPGTWGLMLAGVILLFRIPRKLPVR